MGIYLLVFATWKRSAFLRDLILIRTMVTHARKRRRKTKRENEESSITGPSTRTSARIRSTGGGPDDVAGAYVIKSRVKE